MQLPTNLCFFVGTCTGRQVCGGLVSGLAESIQSKSFIILTYLALSLVVIDIILYYPSSESNAGNGPSPSQERIAHISKNTHLCVMLTNTVGTVVEGGSGRVDEHSAARTILRFAPPIAWYTVPGPQMYAFMYVRYMFFLSTA